jgi:hypothetical protein
MTISIHRATSPQSKQDSGAELEVRMLTGLGSLSAGERRLFQNDAERWEYYAACEAAPPPGFSFGAIAVYDRDGLAAAAPVFQVTYGLGDWLARTFPRYVRLPVLGLGSPLADACHIRFAPHLSDAQRGSVFSAMMVGLEAHAARHGIDIIAVKDVEKAEHDLLGGTLSEAGYTCMTGLPIAVLDLAQIESEEAYLARLSAGTRKDIRRKLRGADGLRVETCHNIAGLEQQIVSLYEETCARSSVDYGAFEKLSPDYFRNVTTGLRSQSLVMLYWRGEELLGFNFLLLDKGRMIDKFIGMRYPAACDHNLYVRSWMENVRYCLRHGIPVMQTGQTAYCTKTRYGSQLDPRWVYFKHRRRFWNWVLAKGAPWAAFDKWDPELAALARKTAQRTSGD